MILTDLSDPWDNCIYEKVHQIDFTSLYPSIIVKFNLSPETLEHPEERGFLSCVLSSLLEPENRDKWMLVTCFGYTGYRNAKFGQI
jgi:DNA polymerase I